MPEAFFTPAPAGAAAFEAPAGAAALEAPAGAAALEASAAGEAGDVDFFAAPAAPAVDTPEDAAGAAALAGVAGEVRTGGVICAVTSSGMLLGRRIALFKNKGVAAVGWKALSVIERAKNENNRQTPRY